MSRERELYRKDRGTHLYDDRPVEVLANKSIFSPKSTIYLHLPNSTVWTTDESVWKKVAPETWKALRAAFDLDVSGFQKPFVIDSRAIYVLPEGDIWIGIEISIADERYGRDLLFVARLLADANDEVENYVTSLEDSISGTYDKSEEGFRRFLLTIDEFLADGLGQLRDKLQGYVPEIPSMVRPI